MLAITGKRTTHSIQNLCLAVMWPVSKLVSIDQIGEKEISLCMHEFIAIECAFILVNLFFISGLDPTNLYRRATQRITFTTLLGSQALAEQYIHLTNDYFLSKGHMVAKADFLHGSAQMATFWYTNAAPQWQTFNGNNWNSLENDARSYASRVNKDLDVYTGTSVCFHRVEVKLWA